MLSDFGSKSWKMLQVSVVCFSLAQLAACNGKGAEATSAKEVDSPKEAIVCATEAQLPSDLKNLNYGPSCSEVTAKFPEILTDKPAENKQVICPFLRMVERTGVWKDEVKHNMAEAVQSSAIVPLRLKNLLAKVLEFGCGDSGCRPVAVGVSAGQQGMSPDKINEDSIVDIGRLADARGTAHDCGYTFGLGETAMNPARRAKTLEMLKARAKNGVELGVNDLVEVKKAWCKVDYEEAKRTSLSRLKNKIDEANQTLVFSGADTVEFLLIFSFLGGVERGHIRYEDVEDFLHARMPAFKTKYLLDGAMQAHLLSIISK